MKVREEDEEDEEVAHVKVRAGEEEEEEAAHLVIVVVEKHATGVHVGKDKAKAHISYAPPPLQRNAASRT